MRIVLGLGPQPANLEHWWHAYKVPHLFLVFGVVYVIGGITLLLIPTKVTSACDTLGDAINELLTKQGQLLLRARSAPAASLDPPL